MKEFDFQMEVIEQSYVKPVLVDFWAAWCGPCRMLSPVLETLATEQAAHWTLVKVNTEAHETLAEQQQILTLPTVKLFYQGKVIAEFMGAYPRVVVERWLQEFLPKALEQPNHNIYQAFPNELEQTISEKGDGFFQ